MQRHQFSFVTLLLNDIFKNKFPNYLLTVGVCAGLWMGNDPSGAEKLALGVP